MGRLIGDSPDVRSRISPQPATDSTPTIECEPLTFAWPTISQLRGCKVRFRLHRLCAVRSLSNLAIWFHSGAPASRETSRPSYRATSWYGHGDTTQIVLTIEDTRRYSDLRCTLTRPRCIDKSEAFWEVRGSDSRSSTGDGNYECLDTCCL